jgi:hypothetical protein
MIKYYAIFVLFSSGLFAQDPHLEINVYNKFNVKYKNVSFAFFDKDSVYSCGTNKIEKINCTKYSLKICFGNSYLIIPKLEDEIFEIEIYESKIVFTKKYGSTNFNSRNIFKKYYYYSLGWDVVNRSAHPRISKKAVCECK